MGGFGLGRGLVWQRNGRSSGVGEVEEGSRGCALWLFAGGMAAKGRKKESARGGEEGLEVSGIGLSEPPCLVACERMGGFGLGRGMA